MTEMGAKRLFLIDAMGLVFRAFYAQMPMRLRSASGLPTNVPYLFAGMLRRLFNTWDPQYLAVVFDPPGPTFRDTLFAEYKAQRPPMPEELSVQLPLVRRLCEAMRLPIIEVPGYEADDAIGSLARQAAAKSFEVYIITSDKDMLQLVSDHVRILRPQGRGGEEVVLDEQGVEELLGVPAGKVVDLMALMGDSTDNIPGARDPNEKPAPGERRKAGIGEVGARQLVQQFGSAEEAVRRAAEVKKASYREALEKYGQFVKLSKELARIRTDAPVSFEPEVLRRREPDWEALRAFYAEMGFASLLKDLPQPPAAEVSPSRDHAVLDSPEALAEFLTAIPPGAETAVWCEVAADEAEEEPGFGSELRAVEISPRPGVSRTVPLGGETGFGPAESASGPQGRLGIAANESAASRAAREALLAALKPWLADGTRRKIVHQPKLVEILLGPVAGVTHAVALYSYLLRPTTPKHSLEDVALRHLSTRGSGAPGECAELLGRLAPLLRSEVEKAGLLPVYERIDLPLAPVLARMEMHGVRVDPEALAELSAEAEREIHTLEQRIWELAGTEFNINSPVQLAEILFDRLGLEPPLPRGRGRERSTAAEVLEELATEHEIARLVLDFRELAKLKSTYADALPRLIHPATGRIHTRLSQTGTATGRLSSSSPNLQNIPVRSELGRKIRAAFTAPPGWRLVSADYSQIELRLLAHYSQDPVLLEAFRRGEDIHARTALEVFGVGPLAQTPEHRRVAKVINFGIIYGLSPYGLGQQLGIETREAAEFIAAYFKKYPRVKAYLDSSIASARATGVARNLFGRVRPIPEINAPQANQRSFAERTALNTPLQGTAADLIKLAMIEIDRRIAADPVLSGAARMVLQVHDELLFEARKDAVERLSSVIRPAMQQVETFDGPLSVPLVVEIKSGRNWAELK
jgi:DNA polymerase-1